MSLTYRHRRRRKVIAAIFQEQGRYVRIGEVLSGTLNFGRFEMSSDVRKAVTCASIGNAAEWFDFAIYGFLATYIAANFFPSGNETAALLNTFAIFAAAVVSLCAVLTIRETAGSPLRVAGSDESFQSGPDVRGAAATR
jgi:hypothetical protein